MLTSDTLHRHELSHHAPGSEGGKDRNHRITVKTFRACFGCASARVRCSGGVPCGRCSARSLDCRYPTQRRSKAKAMRDSSMQELETQDSNTASSLGQFSIHTATGAASSSKASCNVSSTSGGDQLKPIPQNALTIADGSSPRLYLPNEIEGPSSTQLQLDVYPGDRVQTYDTKPGASEVFQMSSSNNIDSEIIMSENHEMSLEFDHTLFDPSMLSTINWLPSELLSGASYGQAPRSTSVSSQNNQSLGPGAYFSQPAWQLPVISAGQIGSLHAGPVFQAPTAHFSPPNHKESPYQSSRAISEPSPHAESVDYCVDGAGSRLLKYRTKHTPWTHSSAESVDVGRLLLIEDGEPRFGFPSISGVRTDEVSEDVTRLARRIEVPTYDEIYRQFITLCCTENPFFGMFESRRFPTVDEFNRFLIFFFDSFQVVYPILHLPTFDPNTCHWLLTLSIVALGCHSSHISEMEQCTTAFHELIRRGIHVEVGDFFSRNVVSLQLTVLHYQKEKNGLNQISLELLQSTLFNCIGLLHSRSEREKASALGTFSDLVAVTKTSRLLTPVQTHLSDASQESAWLSWIRDEVRRRTGYCTWVGFIGNWISYFR